MLHSCHQPMAVSNKQTQNMTFLTNTIKDKKDNNLLIRHALSGLSSPTGRYPGVQESLVTWGQVSQTAADRLLLRTQQ